ncbi:hypothetical protein [Lacinutrix salivirga]
MRRKFKPGDWVKLKGTSDKPKMEVLKYVPVKNIFGLTSNNTHLECVWYKDGKRFCNVFNQNKLIKSLETGGIYNA